MNVYVFIRSSIISYNQSQSQSHNHPHPLPPPKKELGLASPEDLFDIETFRDDPRPFFKFARSLYPGSVEPTPSHYFLADLHRRKTLLRIYTQNIDSLERLSGVGSDKVVYAHGSLSSATCTRCRAAYSSGDIASDVGSGNVPTCRRPRGNKKAKRRRSSAVVGNPTVAKEEELPTTAGAATDTTAAKHSMRLRLSSSAKKSTKSDDGGSYDRLMKEGLCCGVIKPNVTFFGEKLSDEVGRSLQEDSKLADALLVMGTSLSV
jgi:NAD-dependent SIR2 family protein deacetylase